MDIYVGNLPYSATENEIQDLFTPYGGLERVKIINDRDTGRSKGFAFVTMADQSQLQDAIDALDTKDFAGRPLRVNASEPQNSHGGSGSSFAGGSYRNERKSNQKAGSGRW